MLKTVILLHIPGASCFAWLLFAMLIPLLLGLLLGYWLWHRYLKAYRQAEAERDECRRALASLKQDHADLQARYDALAGEADQLRNAAAAAAAAATDTEDSTARSLLAFDFATLFAETNLQIIEGIGPKMEAVLKAGGIGTWAQLGASSPREVKDILDEQGSRYKMVDPTSWPRQAKLAADGRWDELVEYQHFLDAGRETTGDFENPAKIEVMAERLQDEEGDVAAARNLAGALSYASLFPPTNLQIIEGIGPKIEELLRSQGYGNWTALGMADTATLKKILEEGGAAFKMHNPESWPRQAQLAAAGKWPALVEYQAFLDAGREASGHSGTPAKVERMAAEAAGFANSSPEDLSIIEGIGPKIAELLKSHGVVTWQHLARQTVEELREILEDGGDAFRMANPASWPVQARLAVAGDWKALSDYQDFLEGGVEPT